MCKDFEVSYNVYLFSNVKNYQSNISLVILSKLFL